jgi:hypothetical protein
MMKERQNELAGHFVVQYLSLFDSVKECIRPRVLAEILNVL